MAKNAVTDWSTTDSLNTDVGGTNIAESCAPGGINDAIRKLMAQIATFINNALFTGNVSVKPPAADGTVLLYSSGTLKYNLSGRSGGALHASDLHTFKSLSEGVTFLTVGPVNANLTTPMTVNGGLATGGAIRATGNSLANITAGPGLELIYDAGGGTGGSVLAYDRTANAYKNLFLYGLNVNLQPQGGGIYSGGSHNVQGTLSLGGTALGGVNGQLQFNRADGSANLGNISWLTGNEFRIANNNGGAITNYVNGAETFRTLTGGARLQYTQMPVLEFNRAAVGSWYLGGNTVDNGFYLRLNAGAPTLGFDTGSNASFAAAVTTAGNLTVNAGGGTGQTRLTGGSTTQSGRLQFLNPAGTAVSSIYADIAGAQTVFTAGGSQGFFMTGRPVRCDSYLEGATPTGAGSGSTGGVRVKAANTPGGLARLQFTDAAISAEWVNIYADGSKLYINVGGANVFSIDSAGNVRIPGSLAQGVTP